MTAPKPWRDDAEKISAARRNLNTVAIGDGLDRKGLKNRFQPSVIRPLRKAVFALF